MPCCTRKSVPVTIFGGIDIYEVPGCHWLRQMSSQRGSQKLLQGLVFHKLTAYLSLSDLFLTQSIMATLSKGCKPDYFESQNSQKFSFMNQDLCLNFVECEFALNQTLLTFLLYVRHTRITKLVLAISM